MSDVSDGDLASSFNMITKTDQFFAFEATSGSKYFLWTQWKERNGEPVGFDLTLFSGVRTWQGDVSIDSLKASAEKAGIEVDEYIRLAKEALTGRLNPEGKQTVFKYDVAVDGTAKVTWKKQVSEKALFLLGDIDLKETEDNGRLFDSLLEHCSDRFSFLTKRVHRLQEENFRLSDEHKRAMERLTEAAQAKMDVEDRLLGSFVDILNGKKRKISELTLEVDRLREQLKSGPAEAMDVDESAAAYEPSVSKKPSKADKRSKDLEDENEDTDEEKEEFERKREENKKKGPKLEDAGLILTHEDNPEGNGADGGADQGEEDGDDTLFVPRKRQRRTARGKASPRKSTPRSVAKRGRPSRAAAAVVDSSSQSLDFDSPRQTRSSSAHSSNLLSKLT